MSGKNESNIYITHGNIAEAAGVLMARILSLKDWSYPIKLWGVPRGGVCACYALQAIVGHTTKIVDSVGYCDIIVDDIVDSGSTYNRYRASSNKPFAALFDKNLGLSYGGWMVGMSFPCYAGWLVFPWEVGEDGK